MGGNQQGKAQVGYGNLGQPLKEKPKIIQQDRQMANGFLQVVNHVILPGPIPSQAPSEAPSEAPTDSPTDSKNGKEACENRGFTEEECLTIGCCEWTGGIFTTGNDVCLSSVGTSKCSDPGEDTDTDTDTDTAIAVAIAATEAESSTTETPTSATAESPTAEAVFTPAPSRPPTPEPTAKAVFT